LYGNKHGDKFQVRIPSLDSKSGIEHPIFISSCYHNNQCLLEDGAAALEDFLGKECNDCETTIDRAFHYENKKTEKSESFRYRLWLHGFEPRL
jgi:hypothetical protein